MIYIICAWQYFFKRSQNYSRAISFVRICRYICQYFICLHIAIHHTLVFHDLQLLACELNVISKSYART